MFTKRFGKRVVVTGAGVVAAGLAWGTAKYRTDILRERERVSNGSRIAETRCGPIEYAVAGSGMPLLAIHGAGGGFDQGMDLALPFVGKNFQVIAMSRFGYLRTPLPEDASAEAQADAHACLLDALGIDRVAVMGASAGGPSALQFAIRHPDRAAALFLLVPAAYSPNARPVDAFVVKRKSGLTAPLWTPFLFDTALKSDLLFWMAIHAAPDTVTGAILGTPPQIVRNAEQVEQNRIRQMMTHILPVIPRRLGLLNDARITSALPRYDLERIQAPTLVMSVKDDRYGTFEGAQYTAGQIAGARFIGYETGGHLAVGHNQEISEEATRFFREHP